MLTPAMRTWLTEQRWSSFYSSLLTQVEGGRELSERQLQCVINGMHKAMQPKPPPSEPTLKAGALIEVKAFIARRLQSDLSMPYFFRNLSVVEVSKETSKAFQLKVSFVSRIVTSCHVCGRELDTDVSRATGIGPVCADRLGIKRPTLETANETLQAIDILCRNLGVVGPIWVPKSQIKHITRELVYETVD